MINKFGSIVCITLMVIAPVASAETSKQVRGFEGPYFGIVERVIDGDTFVSRVELWPTISATVSVRLKGYDAPEIRRTKCEQEKYLGTRAKTELQELLPEGTEIRIKSVERDSFGRIVGEVSRMSDVRGHSIAEYDRLKPYLVRWDHSQPDIDWCDPAFAIE